MEAQHLTIPDDGDERSSRRELLGRLAGLGLVAAGGMALLPDHADAKPKQRSKRRRGKGTPAPQRSRARLQQAAIVINGEPIVSPHLLITRSITGNWWVQVYGKIYYNTSQIKAMKLGYRYRLTCTLWEYDGGLTLGDRCYSFPSQANQDFPRNSSNIPTWERFAFSADLASAYLNKDDGYDEVYAQLTLWRKAPGSTSTWTKRSLDDTNMIKAPF